MKASDKKALYFDCGSGISGDMAVAALIGLGIEQDKLLQTLQTLPLSGYRTQISTVLKSGIAALDFNVILDDEHENHDHDMEYLHSETNHSHGEIDHSHGETDHSHGEASHSHDTGEHVHRNLNDILLILNESEMTAGAKSLAARIFHILAEAESKAHNKPIDEVHFHEVGAVDSIVDIAAFAICFDMLSVTEVIIPVICEGRGSVRSQHGILPVPVPAVVNIAASYQLPISILHEKGEFITPTGAAIAAAISTSDVLPDKFVIDAIGIGAGKRKYNTPGILRIMQIS